MGGDFSFRSGELPYNKSDSVADLDSRSKQKDKAFKKEKPAVPAKACALSDACTLRKKNLCNPAYCYNAAKYLEES